MLTRTTHLLKQPRLSQAVQRRLPQANNHFFAYGNLGMPVLRLKDNPDFHHDPGHDSEVWKREELRGPGSTHTDVVPNKTEVSTGKERIEHMLLSEGKDPYYGLMDPIKVEAKGTKENPIEVLSPDEDRIVGCQGYPGERHSVQFMMITEDGHNYWQYGHNRCGECGNTYKLKRIEIPYPSIN